VITTCNLSKHYAEGDRVVRALDALDLSVDCGEFVSVTGPSGCGKTTLLQLVGALDTPSDGEIEAAGVSLQLASENERTVYRRQEVGIVFQFFNLLPTLTVAENIGLPLRLQGTSVGEITRRVGSILPRVGLENRATHLPQQLSGGEMQRVALARALVHQPRILLADEPTGNLDSENAALVMTLIHQLHSEGDLTLLLVTHSEEVAEMADRRIRMRDGKLDTES